MSLPHRAYQLFQEEGIEALITGGKRKALGYIDPVYQQVKPQYKRYSVRPASAEFNMSRRRLGKHDFVDDIRSEEKLIRRILSSVRQDDVFYDIGANVGIYTCLVASQLDSGNVSAFEPIPETFEILKRNVDRNDVNAKLFKIALSDRNGSTSMSVRGQTGHQFSESDGTLEIETRRADDLIEDQEIKPPDICKIDIEGAEYLALKGFKKTLAESDCRRIFCEIHTDKIQEIAGSADAVEDLLDDLGFKLEYLGDRRANYFVDATREVS
ncbi:FkbM family methyltransferase [Halorubrum sp. 2020YC2]|uniref:FkbM family methyltransferase n=1 Tax=Halorubrum sp. 2020YC2 TaxID=2836432 RepID=UPI001BE78F86|nr:FkbM family methyltransferase [Halorubrum sp. 2020YC2]QWC20179.1 FkbM family methyltransferase [Halorubrum sp. 2020YC2]